MTTKTSIHWQGQAIPDWGRKYMVDSGAQYVKVMDPGEEDPFPGYKSIVRTFLDDGLSNEWVALGAAGADLWVDRFMPYYAARPWAWAFEGPNEPSIWVDQILDGFEPFTQRLIYRMHDVGLRVVVGNINVGHWQDWQTDIIGRAIQGADYLATHEYGHMDGMWKEEDQTWLCLRYRRLAQWLGELGYKIPPWLITECGIDEVIDGKHYAWKDAFDGNPDPYVEQLAWYEQELCRDDFVKAAFIFTGTPNWDWMNFEVTEELAMKLAGVLSEIPAPPPPVVERARGFMAAKYQTTLNWSLIAKDFDYVLIGITGPNAYPDYTYTEVRKNYDEHVAGANSVGLPKAGFHFLTTLDSQARIFAEAAAQAEWELPLFCDYEDQRVTRAKVDTFLQYADQRLKEFGVVYPELGIYTNLYLWQTVGPWARTLSLAQWGVAEPSISGWSFWQYGGGPVPDAEYTSLEVYNGSVEDLYLDYGLNLGPTEPEEETMIEVVDLQGNVVPNGWENAVAKGASLYSAAPPAGETVWRVKKLILDTSGNMGFRCYARDENGAPIPGVCILEGWNDGQELPANAAPRLTESLWEQPDPARENRAYILPNQFTGPDGYLEWNWGAGEFENVVFPAHWVWVMPGDNEVYSDVLVVPGWWDEHIKYWVVFSPEIVGDDGDDDEEETPELPADVGEAIKQMAVDISALTDAVTGLITWWTRE